MQHAMGEDAHITLESVLLPIKHPMHNAIDEEATFHYNPYSA
jgi:hypothetical protein